MNVDTYHTRIIHKDHPKDQIIGDINSATQTRRMSKISEELAMVNGCKECLLYGTIEEEVYVCQPPGFEDPQFPDKVYKVEKALYGLHQAPRACFSDSDYAGASLDRKSTTRGCQFRGKRLISWQCKKHTIVANSTTKAEYVAAANCYLTFWLLALDYLIFEDMFVRVMIDEFVDQHNMVACLERTEENAEFLQIFWNTVNSQTVNDVKQIHAIVDGKTIVILESSVRSDLHFNDENGITCLTNTAIFENLALMGQGRKSHKTKPMFKDSDFDVLDDAIENVEGGSTTEQITTTGDTLNTASINVRVLSLDSSKWILLLALLQVLLGYF
ncbi:putative ribonuclease H-like domain-containing protein [Tanacetum coccineum]